MILDTCFLVDILRNQTNAVIKAQELEQKGIIQKITAITIFELWQGTMSSQQLQQIQTILPSIKTYSFDIPSAKIGGNIMRQLTKQGIKIDPEDAMIAGIALLQNETVLTRNVKHFERIEGLKIETY